MYITGDNHKETKPTLARRLKITGSLLFGISFKHVKGSFQNKTVSVLFPVHVHMLMIVVAGIGTCRNSYKTCDMDRDIV